MKALRGALERAGIRSPLEGQSAAPVLDSVSDASDPGVQADDPFDIWPADRVRIFMSHRTGQTRDPSRVIESALDSCDPRGRRSKQTRRDRTRTFGDLMVAFVAEGFRESDWCAQEVGWALGRGLVLVPVAMGMQPYGFFGTFQAVQARSDPPVQVAIHIGHAIAIAVFRGQRPDSARLVAPLADSVIDAFCGSASFETARRRFELLRQVPRVAWTPDRRTRIEAACRDNPQIREANLTGGQSIPDAVAGLLS